MEKLQELQRKSNRDGMIISMYRQETIDEIPSLPTEWELDDPPICEEWTAALSKLKKGKAGGKTYRDNARVTCTWRSRVA